MSDIACFRHLSSKYDLAFMAAIDTANSYSTRLRGATLLRVLVGVNFAIFLVMISPIGTSRELYKSLKDSGLANAIFRSMQVWVVASTLIATVLFGLIIWNLRRAGLPVRTLRLEAILLVAWWLTLLLLCGYAFMLGMGG
jgi:hypothetical protein